MRVIIELFNSAGCSLDATMINVADGEDVEAAIAKAMHECLKGWTLAPGDVIRIEEAI